jgi:hypothetical protein
VAHGYPLHVKVQAKCLCCGLPYVTTFTAKSDQVVCRRCPLHLRSGQEASQRRNVEHIALWDQYLGKVRALHSDELRAKDERIEVLEGEVRTRDEKIDGLRADANALAGEMQRVLQEANFGPVREPNERVIRILAGTVAEQADAERERAYRMRN